MAVASETTSTTSSDVARYSIASPSRDAFIIRVPLDNSCAGSEEAEAAEAEAVEAEAEAEAGR